MENPSYWAVVPASVRYDKKLRANAKLLYAEITALCNKQGYCSASNEYFAGLYDLSKKTIGELISQLARCGYVRIDIVRDERQVVVERRIWCAIESPFLPADPPPKNQGTSPENSGDPPPKNREYIKENKTSINNTPLPPTGAGIFAAYAGEHAGLLEALQGFEEMRKAKRKPMTDRARGMLLRRLQDLAPNDPAMQVRILDQSTFKCWLTVFPLDADKPAAPQTPKRQEASDQWVD